MVGGWGRQPEDRRTQYDAGRELAEDLWLSKPTGQLAACPPGAKNECEAEQRQQELLFGRTQSPCVAFSRYLAAQRKVASEMKPNVAPGFRWGRRQRGRGLIARPHCGEANPLGRLLRLRRAPSRTFS